MSALRATIERLFPNLAIAYRAGRDARQNSLQVPHKSPFGFVMAGNKAMISGEFERLEIDIASEIMKTSTIFVDVGANIGFYSLLARSMGMRVISIEPLAENVTMLCRNILENDWKDIEVFPVALGASPGILELYGGGTGASLIPEWSAASRAYKRLVPISTLDTIAGSRFSGEKLFFKIDVEGSEFQVLTGATNVLALQPKPKWLIEVCLTEHHPKGINPYFSDVFSLFRRYGYKAYTLGETRREVEDRDVQRWIRNRHRDFGTHNFLFE